MSVFAHSGNWDTSAIAGKFNTSPVKTDIDTQTILAALDRFIGLIHYVKFKRFPYQWSTGVQGAVPLRGGLTPTPRTSPSENHYIKHQDSKQIAKILDNTDALRFALNLGMLIKESPSRDSPLK
jgi:hypothetical protein